MLSLTTCLDLSDGAPLPPGIDGVTVFVQPASEEGRTSPASLDATENTVLLLAGRLAPVRSVPQRLGSAEIVAIEGSNGSN